MCNIENEAEPIWFFLNIGILTEYHTTGHKPIELCIFNNHITTTKITSQIGIQEHMYVADIYK